MSFSGVTHTHISHCRIKIPVTNQPLACALQWPGPISVLCRSVTHDVKGISSREHGCTTTMLIPHPLHLQYSLKVWLGNAWVVCMIQIPFLFLM